MRGGICMKLIVAVLRKEDEVDTIAELNKKGFFVTELATTGGFLKEKNTTLLIGTDDHKLDAVLAILKQEAGLRKTVTYAETSARAEITLFRLIPRQEAVLCLC